MTGNETWNDPDVSIVESSPKAKAASVKGDGSQYPFDRLEVGQSFTVPLAKCNWKSLRTIVYKRNSNERKAEEASARNERAKEFAFIKHDDVGLAEVARIA